MACVSDLNLNISCIAVGVNEKTDFTGLPTCLECGTNLHEESWNSMTTLKEDLAKAFQKRNPLSGIRGRVHTRFWHEKPLLRRLPVSDGPSWIAPSCGPTRVRGIAPYRTELSWRIGDRRNIHCDNHFRFCVCGTPQRSGGPSWCGKQAKDHGLGKTHRRGISARGSSGDCG